MRLLWRRLSRSRHACPQNSYAGCCDPTPCRNDNSREADTGREESAPPLCRPLSARQTGSIPPVAVLESVSEEALHLSQAGQCGMQEYHQLGLTIVHSRQWSSDRRQGPEGHVSLGSSLVF